ncbi:Fic family protein [Dyella sp. LX-66]|uniref:Fic family protein n=1 Tax=unclassified Dyella TaxID=2634549 RepID=UPI001BE079D4|nr:MULTISPECIES: Fic family protein [unclassified Dyella]MBT2116525.1 Fic family protein [Dyella sp. LX-1]MBT2140532.1 Fic family protein [Dyella sp. LX-66]
MDHPRWIWQQPDWPTFRWHAKTLAPLLRSCQQLQGRLLGMAGAIAGDEQVEGELDTLLQNIITSSAIEGERLNVASVRSSLARRLGVAQDERAATNPRSEGLAELMLDATQRYGEPLTAQRLFDWHAWLFAQQDSLLARPIRVGSLRGNEPMQVVSGRLDRPTVHFEAPPRAGLEVQLDAFLAWFNSSHGDAALDPLLRAGLAHFWFVTLHPFDDGNGRLTRAITDLALAQAEHQAIRFYTMSASILADRAGYYHVLETSQKATLDVTPWLRWFLATLQHSLNEALQRIDRVLDKARFWLQHSYQGLLPEQIKVLNRLLDGGERGFEQGISASKYQAVAKVSKATATRHLADLVEKGYLERLPGGGRSTRYHVKH